MKLGLALLNNRGEPKSLERWLRGASNDCDALTSASRWFCVPRRRSTSDASLVQPAQPLSAWRPGIKEAGQPTAPGLGPIHQPFGSPLSPHPGCWAAASSSAERSAPRAARSAACAACAARCRASRLSHQRQGRKGREGNFAEEWLLVQSAPLVLVALL